MAEFSARMMSALSYLSKDIVANTKSLPKVTVNGEEIVNLKQLSGAMGVDTETAALYVLDQKSHPLMGEAIAQFEPDYFEKADIDGYVRKILNMKPGTKRVRLVQTILGARRFGQPRGSIIVDDGEEPLKNIRVVLSKVPGYDAVADQKGRIFYIGEEANRWVVRDPNNPKIKLYEGKDEKEVYRWLDNYVVDKAGNEPKKVRRERTV